jgi:hypothetical protein
MKAILEFDLPQDKVEFEAATDAFNLVMAVSAFMHYLRLLEKNVDDTGLVSIDEIRQDFYKILEDNDVQRHFK